MIKDASKITLGTVQLGLDYGISNNEGKPSTEKAFEILDAAIDGGITSFDTAAGYGDSEIVLGSYFSRQNKKTIEPEIVTKIVIPSGSSSLSFAEFSDMVLGLIRKSFIRLNSESVYAVMLHNAGDLHKYKKTVVDSLLEAKARGLTKNIGVSIYTLDDAEEFINYGALDCIQLPINIMDMRLADSGILKALKKMPSEIYARSVFLQGLFFMDPDNLPDKLADAKPFLEKLRGISRETGLSIAETAFCYVRDINEIDKIVMGADNADQVRGNIRLMQSPGIAESHLKELRACLADIPEYILNPGNWR